MKDLKKIPKIIFKDKKGLLFILEALGYKSKKGYVVDKKTNKFPSDKKIKTDSVIAITKDKETNKPKFYTNEGELVGDMLLNKFGPFI